MTDFPDLKLKTLVSFPATIIDGIGIDTVKANGSYQFNLAYDDFAPPVSSVTDPTNQNALIWNKITSQYALVPVATLVAGSLTPSNANPIMDGVAAPGVATPYSREDHRHPTDTTLAPLASLQSKIGTVKVQTFTASGTYTPNANLICAQIEAVGGGGGGGGVLGAVGQAYSGSGGGSGGYSRTFATLAAIGASKVVTIGTGGAGGISNAIGASGTATSVGTLCIANGGGPGNPGTAAFGPAAGAGGTAGTGDLTVVGMPGEGGGYNSASAGPILPGGMGGSSHFGGGAVGGAAVSTSSVAGVTATGYGGGGSGASTNSSTTPQNGGAGKSGLVVITEYCSS